MKSLPSQTDKAEIATTNSALSTLKTWSGGLTVKQAHEHYLELTVRTATEVFQTESPVLGLLAKDDADKTSALIEFMIIDLQAFLNVNRTMNEYQVRETAKLIMKRYNFLKIADCKLIFDRMKTGEIKLFEGLDGMKILMAFEKWEGERFRCSDDYAYNQHKERIGLEKQSRDKLFVIGDPDAPTGKQIAGYLEAINHKINSGK